MGVPAADPLVGLLISGAILRIVWQSLRTVGLRALDGIEHRVVEGIRAQGAVVPGVRAIDDARPRWIGHVIRAELRIALAPGTTVEQAEGHRRTSPPRGVRGRRARRGGGRRTPPGGGGPVSAALDAIERLASRTAEVHLIDVPREAMGTGGYDVVVGDLLYTQLRFPALLDAGVAPQRRTPALRRHGQRLTDGVVRRLHASAPGGRVVHVNDVAGWWPGHDQPLAPEEVLAARPGPAALLHRLGRPAGCDVAGSVRRTGERVASQRRWTWPFAEDTTYLVQAIVVRCRSWTLTRPRASAPGLRCRVCAGELRLLLPGADAPVSAAAFSPSCHEVGLHGDLLDLPRVRRRRPARAARRRGAARPLPRHARRVLPGGGGGAPRHRGAPARADRATRAPSGRLLDVGCGHGLLLDEAARRGYDAVGIELSRDAARHALARRSGSTSASCALEALRGRRAASTWWCWRTSSSTSTTRSARSRAAPRCCAPAGCCASSRPIPSSPTARLAGRAVVGLPARPHVPAAAPHAARAARRRGPRRRRRRRRSCARSRCGAGSVASPSASGRCRAPSRQLARRVPARASLSLSLGDERVVLAQRVDVSDAPDPLMTDRRRGAVRPRRPARLRGDAHDPAGDVGDARRVPPTARCSSTTPAPTRRRRSPSTTASTSCATRSTSGTGRARRPGTCARCSTARMSSSWSMPTTSTTPASCP